jgi:putative CocE/NonD family hydrolase
MRRSGRLLAFVLTLASIASAGATAPPPAGAEDDPMVTEDIRVPMSDGTELLVRLGGRGPLEDGRLPTRPVIVEMSPYAPGCCPEHGGPAYNHLQVHIRGTGASDGTFDALGPRTQQDLAEVLGWACEQPWSDGRIGLWGFSASAIVVYNSLHQELPCVETAVLGSGTHELYRDLLYPGGIPNGVPALGVFGLIGAPTAATLPDRFGRDPLSMVPVLAGYPQLAADYLAHSTLDDWWRERGMRGDANDLPVLAIDGFFDVEARGAFEAFQELAGNGSHLYVVGAHDGVPVGSGGTEEVTRRWFDHHLRDLGTGIEDDPAVQLWLADGDRAEMLAGRFVTATADAWPVPGTTWVPLHLSGERSGTARSLNDGTLRLDVPNEPSSALHVPIPSLATATDAPTTSLLGLFNGSPQLTTMDGPEALGLSWTTDPFGTDVLMAGPASVELALTSGVPEGDLWVVLSDVHPDGTAHPMATGRLRSSFPDLVEERTRRDASGAVIQPLNDLSTKRLVPPGTEHRYFVELWPIGNRFKAGHRLRLHLVGSSLFSVPTTTGPMLVREGGADGGSVLRVPVLPGSDLPTALEADGGGPSDPSAGPGPEGSAPDPTDPDDRRAPSVVGSSASPARLPATGGEAAAPLAALGLGLAALARAVARRASS